MRVDWEVIVGFFFLAFMGWAIWRGGSANPVGTGQLQKQVNTIGSQVRSLALRVDACATTAEVESLRSEIASLEAKLATSNEVIAVEGQIATLNTRVTGMERLLERTDGGVQRLEGYFLARGIDR